MSDTVIKLENIGKQYRLGTVGSGTLRGDLQRWWYRMRGKEDPALKIGATNQLDTIEGEYVWALRDINLEVKQGEVLGIIGKNGAGKSTLLKLLSRVTGPTTGQIKVKGRIASLLEVGTGFHPELTGRENIFLNGAILGMTKAEIRSKFDEIVDFAGVAKYIDTPVKRYSSGMYVRLAFAVAAHLEPDILVVDEVLAVGDAEFQKKAIGKMQDVSRGGGRTVLFVSHNMGSIRQLCNRTILLEKGKIKVNGEPDKVIKQYLTVNIEGQNLGIKKWDEDSAPGNDKLKLLGVNLNTKEGKIKNIFRQDERFFVKIKYRLYEKLAGYRINLFFKTVVGDIVFVSSSHNLTQNLSETNTYELIVEVPENLLNSTRYIVAINIGIPGVEYIIKPFDLFFVDIENIGSHGSSFTEQWPGCVSPHLIWNLKNKI